MLCIRSKHVVHQICRINFRFIRTYENCALSQTYLLAILDQGYVTSGRLASEN